MRSNPPPPPSPLLPPPLRGEPSDSTGSPPPGRDPEFDPIVPDGALEAELTPELFQRLLANPFLGIATILAWLGGFLALVFHGLAGPLTLVALLLMFAGLALIPGRFQFHCLDCGKTGRLSEWRRHLCPSIAERRIEGRVRRLRGPSPPVQVVLWLWTLMLLFLFLHAAGIRMPNRHTDAPPAPPAPRARRLERIEPPIQEPPISQAPASPGSRPQGSNPLLAPASVPGSPIDAIRPQALSEALGWRVATFQPSKVSRIARNSFQTWRDPAMSGLPLVLSLILVPLNADEAAQAEAEPLTMTDPIACRAIRGYGDYDILDPVEVTPDEKLLIYVQSRNHAFVFDEERGEYSAHLIEDVNLRQKGRKRILVGREKVVDLKISDESPPVNLYLGTVLGLKKMPPGEYEADLILKDALRPGSTTQKSIAFRILPRKQEPAPEPEPEF